jgi:hypothetical protein
VGWLRRIATGDDPIGVAELNRLNHLIRIRVDLGRI